jgi:hypothetical protein
MVRQCVVAGTVFAALAWGQGTPTLFQKAPPDVDAKLRARIEGFYQSHVDGKFRQADNFVHEDSKEIFFAAEKIRYKSFKLVSINYEENYTKAKVVIEVPWELVMPGFGKMDGVPRPMSSTWKLDGGEWWWYVIPFDPCKGIETPFGIMHKQECKDGKPVGPVTGAPGGTFGDLYDKNAISLKELHSKVSASANSILISSHQKSETEIVITSRFDGPVTLDLELTAKYPGFEAVLERDKLEPGESTVVRFRYVPPSPTLNPDFVCRIRVMPLSQIIPIAIRFATPPVEQAKPAALPKQ